MNWRYGADGARDLVQSLACDALAIPPHFFAICKNVALVPDLTSLFFSKINLKKPKVSRKPQSKKPETSRVRITGSKNHVFKACNCENRTCRRSHATKHNVWKKLRTQFYNCILFYFSGKKLPPDFIFRAEACLLRLRNGGPFFGHTSRPSFWPKSCFLFFFVWGIPIQLFLLEKLATFHLQPREWHKCPKTREHSE